MSLRIYGNRALKTLPGQATRPTPARVREALFNIWQGTVEGCRWLDLCAGSGAMGAEALCRGAHTVVGIEQSGQACRIIRDNWQRVVSEGQSFELLRGDVLQQLVRLRKQTFDRVYFDPPYGAGLYDEVLKRIVDLDLLETTGEIAVEHQPSLWQPQDIAGLEILKQKRYGTTHLIFYGKAA